jgi:hypothetical protein
MDSVGRQAVGFRPSYTYILPNFGKIDPRLFLNPGYTDQNASLYLRKVRESLQAEERIH